MINLEIDTLESMIPWVLLHRTHLKAHLHEPIILEDYVKEIQYEYNLIEPFLPPVDSVTSILDIGCGLAGIDILLQRHYPKAKLYLLEGDGPASDWGAGWNAHFKPFNSLKLTYKFLNLNGVEPAGLINCDMQEDLDPDLCVSFLSWGFHYSLFKYRVRTPCAIATIRKPAGDMLFTQHEYRGKQLGKVYDTITSTDKYDLLKFTFNNTSDER